MGYATLVRVAWKKSRLGQQKEKTEDKPQAGFGAKSIGVIGSLCLVTNNIIGPGLFQLPGLFQQAGWMPCMICITIAALWTSQSALYISKCMQGFPGGPRLEVNALAFHLLPRWAYYLTVATLCCVLFAQNVANVLMCSQVMDETLLAIFGKACAFDYAQGLGVCVSADTDNVVTDSLFGNEFVVSVGYAIVLVVCIPLGILNLEDNISIQVGGMLLTLVCVIVWVFNFISIGLTPAFVPAFGSGVLNYAPLISTVLFNYGFVATIPSWINEKSPKVNTALTIWWSNALATAQYLLIAIFGALAIQVPGASSTDILSVINEGNVPGVWAASQICTFIFPIANILTSIPIFSIIIRYNLLQLHGVKVPVWVANLLAVVMPWVVVLPFYPGDTLDLVITWSSALLFCLLNLILPLAMYIRMEGMRDRDERIGDESLYPKAEDGTPLASDGTPVVLDGSVPVKPLFRLADAINPSTGTPTFATKGGSRLLLTADALGGINGNEVDEGEESPFIGPDGELLTMEEQAQLRRDVTYDDGVRIYPACCRCGERARPSERTYATVLFWTALVVAVATFGMQVLQTLS
jgi:amino acid permease